MNKVSDLFICLSENILKSIYCSSAAIMQSKCKNPYLLLVVKMIFYLSLHTTETPKEAVERIRIGTEG